jgi:hypothetical protein
VGRFWVRVFKYAYWGVAVVGFFLVVEIFEVHVFGPSAGAAEWIEIFYVAAAGAGYWLLLRILYHASDNPAVEEELQEHFGPVRLGLSDRNPEERQ